VGDAVLEFSGLGETKAQLMDWLGFQGLNAEVELGWLVDWSTVCLALAHLHRKEYFFNTINKHLFLVLVLDL
jgi:hypothetical protein